MNIGLLMINGEDDVLERTLAANTEFVDCFYVLDGTLPNKTSRAICQAHAKCAGYITDADLLNHQRFPGRPVDGFRQAIYEMATGEHGHDHWFLLLHGDELWTGIPADLAHHQGFLFQLPLHFPRAGEEWDYSVHPLDQLRWHLAPGYPEFRMFHGGADVMWDPAQHHNVVPNGIARIGWCDHPIRHYLYRSPADQIERAARHQVTGFDPGNYQHILNGGHVYWTDEMIADYQQQPYFRDLCHA